MNIDQLRGKLKEYKHKYFINKLLKGGILFISMSLIISLLALFTDYMIEPGITGRTILFYASLLIITWNFYYFIIPGFLGYLDIGKFGKSDEDVAREIGDQFSDVKDKVLNALQLEKIAASESELILASINQKIENVKYIRFKEAINFRDNIKYLKYIGATCILFIITGLSFPPILTDSPERLLNHRTYFEKSMPFRFILLNEELKAFRGDDYTIQANLDGNYIPSDLYVNIEGRRVKMIRNSAGSYEYTFSSLQKSLNFQLEAAGYQTDNYLLRVRALPELMNFEVLVDYPAHTQLSDYQVSGSGNFTIPDGTKLNWIVRSAAADSICLMIENNDTLSEKILNNVVENLDYTFRSSSNYRIRLFNEFGETRERIEYRVDVIKDEFPDIKAELFVDTLLYEFVVLTGSIRDDYGFRNLYATLYDENNNTIESIPIEFSKGSNNQSYYKRINLSGIEKGENSTLNVTVVDNDAINGFKSSKSRTFRIKKPTKRELSENIDKKEEKTENELYNSKNNAEELNEQLKELEERLRMKNKLDWQEEKMIEDLLKKREEIEEQIKNLKEEFKNLQAAENQFNERSERLREKSQNLESLLNESMDPETQKLYEELKKLMEENEGVEQIQKQLSKITPNESNLEKELERALELFKRLKLESKLEKTSNELKELGEKQEELSKETKEGDESSESKTDTDSGNDKDSEKEGEKSETNNSNEREKSASEKQQEINEEFSEIQKQMEEIQKMNQELKEPEPLQNTNSDQQEIQEQLDEIMKQLQQNQKQKASEGQQKSGQKMQQLGEKMQNMQMGMQMEMMRENIDDLRKILDDLIKLSFNQEKLIDGFKEVKQIDPRFVELSQDQLKLKNDSKVIEDSLLAIASRVDQISSFVTREVAAVNENIDKALNNLRERDRNRALSNQQFAMASINNLALLLDDVLQNMQMSMSQSMGNPQKSEGQKSNLPDLKELQKQLSEQIENLQKGNKEGRELSEELAKLAAEQEMIRNQLKQLSDNLNQENAMENDEAGSNLKQIQKLMEENEVDLVNKEITRRLIQRQKDIMTRLLEAEDALREQKLDPEREGEAAEEYQRKLPPSFEEYLKEREKEIELLKSLPLDFNPFYKKEVNDYFRRVTSDN